MDVLTHIGLMHYLVVSTLVFAFGCAIVMVRRNIVAMLMGVELIMNAAALNFVAFDRYILQGIENKGFEGQLVAIFIIVAAAAEAAVALALALNFFNRFESINVDEGSELKE